MKNLLFNMMYLQLWFISACIKNIYENLSESSQQKIRSRSMIFTLHSILQSVVFPLKNIGKTRKAVSEKKWWNLTASPDSTHP